MESLKASNKINNDLYQVLPKNTPILIGDRSLSTYGKRILKGMRAKESGWPLPGIYTPVDLAERLLQTHALLRPLVSDLEIFSKIVSERPNLPLEEIYDDYLQAKNLRKIISFEEAANILVNGELGDKSHGVVFTLLLQKNFAENRFFHSFDVLEKACELLSKEDIDINFHVPEKITEIYLLGFRELYPLELKFLHLLERQFKIIKQSDSYLETPIENEELKKTVFIADNIQNRKQILWLNELSAPGPLEAQVLSGSKDPIRMSIPSQLRSYSPALEEWKKKWPSNSEQLLNALTQEDSEPVKKLLHKIIAEKSTLGLKLLDSFSFFHRLNLKDDSVERDLPFAKSPTNPVLLSAEDLPLILPEQCLIWGAPVENKIHEYVSDFCSGLDHLKKYRDLEKAILAEGISPPRIEEEQKNFERIFYSFAPSFKALTLDNPTTWKSTPLYEIKTEITKTTISPSALENLYKCPLNFHYQREKKLPQMELEDDLNISPLRRGNWIHYTLETLNWHNPKKISVDLIKSSLIKNLTKAFQEKASPAYLKIIGAQVDAMAEALFHYVQYIDIPLYESLPGRQSKAELEIASLWNKEITLQGRVDRMDFVGDGAFLWDYKSGNYSKQSLAKQLESGKFQWLLYREIFFREGTPIHGGGYINPLDMRKSRLFFFSKAPLKESFYERLDKADVRFELIKADEEEMLQSTLSEKVDEIIKVWKSGLRRAMPREKNECNNCAFIGLCGYPYGVTP